MDNTLEKFTKEIVATYKQYESTGTVKWTYEIAAKDLAYQLGSLTKALMQLKGERYSDGKDKVELKRTISDELADILAEVLFIAHELDIDINQAWENMVHSDNKKISSRS